jgi:hypothetical protein
MHKSSFRLSQFGSFFAVVLIALSLLTWMGCERSLDSPSEPQEQDALSLANPKVQEVATVQDNYTNGLMANPEVVGTATGLTEDGRLAILVFAKSEKIQIKDKVELAALKKGAITDAVPTSIEGLPVVVEVTGVIRAMKSGGGVSHTAKQTPPIQLGTSGGWRYDLANGYCCGGTLGSLIQKGGTQYILSNYHVLYADIVAGGNSRTAQPGDYVIQPGLIDVSCNAANAQNVATLVANGGSLPSANVDAGIAQVIPGMVRTDGAILEIGTISATTIAASIGQAVKKSGRTTGLTRSSVTGLNATVSVAYDNECAGGAAFTKTFTGQIIIRNRRSGFLNSGDSGSLMVQDVTTNPKAVGLLYAGSSTTAVANPIGAVLSWVGGGATMVGQ